MFRFLAFAILCIALAAQGAGLAPQEKQTIEQLIAAVTSLPDAQFIRNGTAYDAAEAGDHLRLKWKNAGSRVKTVEDFIRYCASTSSVSGEAYKIRFADGREVSAEQFLRQRLAELKAVK
jgi:hypothetical protein